MAVKVPREFKRGLQAAGLYQVLGAKYLVPRTLYEVLGTKYLVISLCPKYQALVIARDRKLKSGH